MFQFAVRHAGVAHAVAEIPAAKSASNLTFPRLVFPTGAEDPEKTPSMLSLASGRLARGAARYTLHLPIHEMWTNRATEGISQSSRMNSM